MMTYMSLEGRTPHAVISEYIVERKSKGLSLSYSDLPFVDKWLQLVAGDDERLMEVLDEVLDESESRNHKKKLVEYPLKVWDAQVCHRLTGLKTGKVLL